MDTKDIKQIREEFSRHFATEGELYTSPGRINLIGEHTDYNGGFVFPGAIDKSMVAEIKPNGTDKIRAYSVDLKDYAEFGLEEEDKPSASWACYIFGVAREILWEQVCLHRRHWNLPMPMLLTTYTMMTR